MPLLHLRELLSTVAHFGAEAAHPARAAAAPAAITRYQDAMALPSQGVQRAPQAAAKGTASGGWR